MKQPRWNTSTNQEKSFNLPVYKKRENAYLASFVSLVHVARSILLPVSAKDAPHRFGFGDVAPFTFLVPSLPPPSHPTQMFSSSSVRQHKGSSLFKLASMLVPCSEKLLDPGDCISSAQDIMWVFQAKMRNIVWNTPLGVQTARRSLWPAEIPLTPVRVFIRSTGLLSLWAAMWD